VAHGPEGRAVSVARNGERSASFRKARNAIGEPQQDSLLQGGVWDRALTTRFGSAAWHRRRMKTSHRCPKCESRGVAVLRDVGVSYVSGEDVRDRYWCTECGYTEVWFREPERLLAGLRAGEMDDEWEWLGPPESGPFR